MNKHPEQTELTRKAILDAFWLLAKENGIGEVSASSVMKKAGYNRGTFYVYFTDIPDVIHQTEEGIINEYTSMLSEYASDGIPKDLSSVISVMIQKMNDFGDRLFILLGNGGDPNFLPMVRNTFIEHLPLPFPNKGYVISYITSALVGVLIYWYETGKKDSLETVIEVTHKLITKGIPELMA